MRLQDPFHHKNHQESTQFLVRNPEATSKSLSERTLELSLKTEKKFWFIHFKQPEQRFNLNWQLNVPLIGLITRPNYAGIRHFANGEFLSNLYREMEYHIEFASLNNFIMLNSQFEFWAPLGNNNKLKITYQWEGFSYYGNYTHVQSTMWSIMIGVMFKIDSRPAIDQALK